MGGSAAPTVSARSPEAGIDSGSASEGASCGKRACLRAPRALGVAESGDGCAWGWIRAMSIGWTTAPTTPAMNISMPTSATRSARRRRSIRRRSEL
jgi:hypothetical protein